MTRGHGASPHFGRVAFGADEARVAASLLEFGFDSGDGVVR